MKRESEMRLSLLLPLVSYVVPTVAIGYGYVIPRSAIAGVNELTVGFAASILGACVTYVVGVSAASRARAAPSPG